MINLLDSKNTFETEYINKIRSELRILRRPLYLNVYNEKLFKAKIEYFRDDAQVTKLWYITAIAFEVRDLALNNNYPRAAIKITSFDLSRGKDAEYMQYMGDVVKSFHLERKKDKERLENVKEMIRKYNLMYEDDFIDDIF